MKNILVKCKNNHSLDYWFKYFYRFLKKKNVNFIPYKTKREIIVLNKFNLYFIVDDYYFYREKTIGRRFNYITTDIQLGKDFIKEVKEIVK